MDEYYELINWNLHSNEASVNSDLNLNFLLFAFYLLPTNNTTPDFIKGLWKFIVKLKEINIFHY